MSKHVILAMALVFCAIVYGVVQYMKMVNDREIAMINSQPVRNSTIISTGGFMVMPPYNPYWRNWRDCRDDRNRRDRNFKN